MLRFLFILVLFFFPLLSLKANSTNPQDLYLQIYLKIQEAEKLENKGKIIPSYKVYKVILSDLISLQESHPNWEVGVISYRTRYAKKKVALLEESKKIIEGIQKSSQTSPSISFSTDQNSLPSEVSSYSNTEPQLHLSAKLLVTIQSLQKQLKTTKKKLIKALGEEKSLRTKLEITEKKLVMKRVISSKKRNSRDPIRKALQKTSDSRLEIKEAQEKIKKIYNTSASNLPHNIEILKAQLKTVKGQIALLDLQKKILHKAADEFKEHLETVQQNIDLKYPQSNSSRETQVLHDIISRQLQTQTRKESSRRLALEEVQKLILESKALKTQIEILSDIGIPRKLSSKELAMMHSPIPTPREEYASATSTSSPSQNKKPSVEYRLQAKIPEDMKEVVFQANELLKKNDLKKAIKLYKKLLTQYPESLYGWSNLGVIYFQNSEHKKAKSALLQAIRLNPMDAFSYTLLGLNYYQTDDYINAIESLTKAIALNPDNPQAHNYLGITSFRKGWIEPAEKSCRHAIKLAPSYGNAHFNLAIIYATQTPPSQLLGLKHYKKAIELGLPRDITLEKKLSKKAL